MKQVEVESMMVGFNGEDALRLSKCIVSVNQIATWFM